MWRHDDGDGEAGEGGSLGLSGCAVSNNGNSLAGPSHQTHKGVDYRGATSRMHSVNGLYLIYHEVLATIVGWALACLLEFCCKSGF